MVILKIFYSYQSSLGETIYRNDNEEFHNLGIYQLKQFKRLNDKMKFE